jgi:hypothetical protein
VADSEQAQGDVDQIEAEMEEDEIFREWLTEFLGDRLKKPVPPGRYPYGLLSQGGDNAVE